MRHDEEYDQDHVPRRGFFEKFIAGMIGAVVGIVPMVAAGGFLLGPILGKNRNGQNDAGEDEIAFLPLDISPDALVEGGPPQLVTVVADRVDAWNFYPKQPVGSVWVRKNGDGQIIAFNTICPHLGCSVDYRSSHGDFYCPCHLSNFDLQGARQNMVPPRDMDSLETRIVEDRVWVAFQNFRGGVADKTPV